MNALYSPIQRAIYSAIRHPLDVRRGTSAAWSPLSLFSGGQQGGWYDPSDLGTMFQDSAGTTPVTGVEQPVGRWLDKSGRGNHLIQPTSASRPTFSRRYNLLLSAFAGAVAGTPGTAPTGWSMFGTGGTTDAVTALGDGNNSITYSATAARQYISFPVTSPASTSYVLTCSIGSVTGTIAVSEAVNSSVAPAGTTTAYFINGSPVAANTPLPANSVVRLEIAVGATAGTVNIRLGVGATVNSTATVTFFRPDMRRTLHTTMGMPAYQRVTTATGYDESGFLPRLRFDGADDSMYTAASVDFSATDEMTVLAGVSKLSDAAFGYIVELSPTSAANPGVFGLLAPGSSSVADYGYRNRGTSDVFVTTAATFAAPRTDVLTGLGDISADLLQLRVRGALAASSSADQGTGNYGNYVMFVGRRNNASATFNGDVFQLIVRGALTSGADLISAEQYVAQRTGVTL